MINVKASLFDTIRSRRGLWFGVIDGAQIDDVVSALSQAPLQSRPLYIGLENKPEQLNDAPFLVGLNEEGADRNSLPDEALIKQCFDIAETSSACVFWQCDAGGEVLYHHLRSINKIVAPQMHDGMVSQAETETVLFRHGDANVMAQVLPAVNLSELSRLLGPADLILARPDNEWGDGLIYALRTQDMPEPHVGLLHLSPQTYQEININRHQGIINQIELFLNKITAHAKPMPQEIRRISRASFVEAYKNGIRSQSGFYSWAYFYHEFGGSFGSDPDMREYLAHDKEKSRDALLKDLQRQTTGYLKNMGA